MVLATASNGSGRAAPYLLTRRYAKAMIVLGGDDTMNKRNDHAPELNYVACSLISDDDGKTWQRSNLIDLGGHGHHSGAMEPTGAELGDGRLLMLIRTHWGRFREALSDDGGLSWRTVRPSQIESTSAPGFLRKLRSGRLALVSNDKAGRPCLLLRLSEDDGKSWTEPVVLARQKDGQLSYPYCMERRPGELWVIAGFAFKKGWQKPLPSRLKIDEEGFLREAKKGP